MVQRIRLGELLVKAGVLDELQLRSALNEQQKWGGQLGKILVDLGYVDEPLLVKALSKQLGVPRAHLETADIPIEVMKRIDPNSARTHRYCPERFEPSRRVLTVAMSDPTDVEAIDDLAFRTGCRVQTTLAGDMEVSRAIDRLFFGRVEQVVELGVNDALSRFPVGAEQGPFSEIDLEARAKESLISPKPPIPSPEGERFGPLEPLNRSSSVRNDARVSSATRQTSSRLGSNLSYNARSEGHIASVVGSTPASGIGGSSFAESTSEGIAAKLEAAQKRQNRAIRVMIDMLIERGVFSEEEFRARLGVHRSRNKR